MDAQEINFENLPKAVAHLVNEIAEIKSIVEKRQVPAIPTKKIPIDISEACKLIGKSKPTIYTLVRERKSRVTKTVKTLLF
jgi:excisionase family DNA binding protein